MGGRVLRFLYIAAIALFLLPIVGPLHRRPRLRPSEAPHA